MIDIAIVIIYTVALLIIFLYSLVQLSLLFSYLKAKKIPDTAEKFDFSNDNEVPFVTIQLPVYNEMYVMERLLNNISLLTYPKNKLEIQVLDDSTDETVADTAEIIKNLQRKGINIHHIQRKNRTGFKAGALKEGLSFASGEFIAIFDADFMPSSNWLMETVPYFKNSKIGVVQTRWGHLNRNYSMLTKIQAFALDFHFTMEQVGRNSLNHFINFNGTAGIWRKACILDAGNWQGDTLTEDLDLSYRAQLKKWQFKYLEDVETPAELPIVISAARSQQFRWNKGAAENFQKNFIRILKDGTLPLKTKLHSFFHLLNSSMFLLVFLVAILSVPILYIKNNNPLFEWYFLIIAFFSISTAIFFICYWHTFKKINGGGFWKFLEYIKLFFVFFAVAMGFSIHNSIAVLEGHFGKKSEFVRTPKFNIGSIKESWKANKYLNKNISKTTALEALSMCYFGYALYSAYILQDFGLTIFHLMLFFGFGYVFIKSITARL